MTDLNAAIDVMHIAENNARELRKQCCTLWLDAIRERHNLTEGSTVKYKGKLYRVNEITIAFDWSIERKPHCKGNPLNEQGKPGKGERMLSDGWEVVQG
jgi:hypothetical protein